VTTSAREEVLGRIRTALGRTGAAAPQPSPVPRDYRTSLGQEPGAPGLLDLLVDRLVDYKAVVHRCPPDAVGATVAAALAARCARRVAAPSGLPAGWLAGADVETVTDGASPDDGGPLSVATLDAVDGVVTGCAVAVAQTGTIVLDSSPVCGRRALTLVPDYHLLVVEAAQVVGSVPEALPRLDPARPLTWVSGPSATSDIELDRVEGVHGPRTLVVVLVEG
jgi:L-lactate dehydrogenase complex protein LldG